MKRDYEEIYKRLVRAYYQNRFEFELEKIYLEEFDDKEKANEILAILCGIEDVSANDSKSFVEAIVQSIVSKKVRTKIINKISSCNENCKEADGRTACQLVCPMDAILTKNTGNERWIDSKQCIYCGRCIPACEQQNILDTPQFMPVASILKEEEVYAIVAPAIAGQFGKDVSLDMMREALVRVGFTDMLEVAFAADVLALKEALEFHQHIQTKEDFMITSCCCPVWVSLMKKTYEKLIRDLSPSVSPMIAMGRIIKRFHPKAKVVFIGPCVAKKAEAKESNLEEAIDYVLTFQELKTIFEILEINPREQKGLPAVDYASTCGRLYARAGGVSQAVYDIVDQMFLEKRKLFSSFHVDGVNKCKKVLEELEQGEVRASFIEGMGCIGGCVGGPKAILSTEEGRDAVNETAYDSAVKIPVNSETMLELLNQLGIEKIEELIDKGSMFERKFE